MSTETRKVDVSMIRFGEPSRISESDSRLIAYGLDEDGDESVHLEVICAMVDPSDEMATIKAVVDLCNGRAEIAKALIAAEALIDSVVFVRVHGDTAKPLALIRAALARIGGSA